MRFFSPLTGLVLLAVVGGCADAQTASEAKSAYPVSEVLQEYKAACSAYTTRETAASNVKAAGWNEVADIAKSPMGPSIARTDEFGATIRSRPGGGYKPVLLFTKKVAGEQMFITVTESALAGRQMIGCRLFDLGDTRLIDQAEAEKLVGRSVSQVQDAQGIHVLLWLPGLTKPQSNFEIWQIPPISPAAIENKFDGIMLRSDYIGTASS